MMILMNFGLVFQSTLPTRGSDGNIRSSKLAGMISIHAPHEGERPTMILYCPMFVIFQSTLPTRGSDILQNSHAVARVKFQSTLPTRGSD